MYVLLIVVCPFVLFLLAIVLSVLLRYTDSDYPFWYLQILLKVFSFTRPVLEPTIYQARGEHQLMRFNIM